MNCQYCGKKFKNIKDLNKHVIGFKCEICDITLPCESLLNVHKKSSHENEKGVNCPYCGKKFKEEEELIKHTTGFECEKCQISFPCRVILKNHDKVIHEKSTPQIKCPHCGNKIPGTKALKKHIAHKHKDEEPDLEEVKKITIDLHGLFINEIAEKLAKRIEKFKSEKMHLSLTLIHGYHSGQSIRNYVRTNEFKNDMLAWGYRFKVIHKREKGKTIFQVIKRRIKEKKELDSHIIEKKYKGKIIRL